jgi:hypothetical protein
MSGKFQAVLLLAVMFGLGFASGIAWHRYQLHRFPSAHSSFASHRIQRLKSQLHLSNEQEQALDSIFQKAHERAVQVNEEVAWDLADIHRDTVKAISGILTPAQMADFEKLHKRFHDTHRHFPTDEDFDESTGTVRAAAS